MNIHTRQFDPRAGLNGLWARLRQTWIAPHIQHKAQMLSAAGILEMVKRHGGMRLHREQFAQQVLGMPLCGAGYGWESRMPLIPDPSGTSPVVVSGANTLNFNLMDNVSVLVIGFVWEVAGTVTALVADFDKYTGPDATGTVTDKLDATNGTITAPTVAGQAIGNVLYKDLGNTLDIDLTIGNSVQFIVTTTCTAGSGIPFVLVVPRPETLANITAAILSS